MTDTDAADFLDRARNALDLSVYNLVSLGRHDLPCGAVADLLCGSTWAPAFAPTEDVVTEQTVRAAAMRLQSRGLVRLDDDTIRIDVRDPDGRGRSVGLSADRRTWTGLPARGSFAAPHTMGA